jgi:hypothetical protein
MNEKGTLVTYSTCLDLVRVRGEHGWFRKGYGSEIKSYTLIILGDYSRNIYSLRL